MKTGFTFLAIALAVALTGCSSKKGKDPDPGSGTAVKTPDPDPGSGSAKVDPGSGSAAAGSGSAAAGSGSDSMAGSGSGGAEKMPNQAGNCPSTVLGAETKAELKGKDIILTISATDPDAVAAIQKRTDEVLKEKSDGGAAGKEHDHKGTHGGSVGLCPVHWGEGGKATSKKAPKGVTITITPKDKPEDLKKVIDERITKAAEFIKTIPAGEKGNKGGVGGGKGEHGSTHSGEGDGKGKERKGDGKGGGGGSGGGGGKGTGGGGSKAGAGSAKKEGGW